VQQLRKVQRECAVLRDRARLLEQKLEAVHMDLEAEQEKVRAREELVARAIQEKGTALQKLTAAEASLRKQVSPSRPPYCCRVLSETLFVFGLCPMFVTSITPGSKRLKMEVF
jgi:hypothetical protein